MDASHCADKQPTVGGYGGCTMRWQRCDRPFKRIEPIGADLGTLDRGLGRGTQLKLVDLAKQLARFVK